MMLSVLLTALFAAPALPLEPIEPASVLVQDKDPKAVYEKMREEAGDDLPALWKVHEYCLAYGLEREGRSVLRKILKLDDSDRKAHDLMGHVFYDGKWFTSDKKLEAYKKDQEEEAMKAKGLVRFGDEWVSPDDLPHLERGLVKMDDGRWVSPEEKQRIEEGWKLQDLEWIEPGDFEKIEKGLWKCGDQWLPLDEADRYHSQIGRWWKIPTDHFVAFSTCDRETTLGALDRMETSYRDLVRFFGKKPDGPRTVILLNGQTQYNAFAGGNTSQPKPEQSGHSAFHSAFLCESWIDLTTGQHPGAACTYWDASTEAGPRWGNLAVRHAAGQAYAEGVDPSPRAMRGFMANPTGQFPSGAFWAEKQLPLWMRYGAASYVERYYIDATAGDPHWAREWSIANLLRQGGLDPLERIFTFPVGAGEAGSAKLVTQAGLLVAFILDGKCVPVGEKHAALKHALKTGEKVPEAARDLQKEVTKHEAELREFAGL